MILNYLGSKARFMPILNRVIEPVIDAARKSNGNKPVVFADMFAGTGIVANHYKDNPSVSHIISSDLELYSYVLNKALLETVCNNKLLRLISYFNSDKLRPIKGLIWKHFSPAGGRMFYTEENAMRIDAIRVAISKLYQARRISYKEVLFLLSSLMMACSRSANSASCFRAYLKKFCPRSLKRVVIIPIHKNTTRINKQHVIHQMDASRVVKKYNIDVAYLDPPYNSNHYGGYYSFYNYLLRYSEACEIGGVAGVTKVYNKSAFGLKATAKKSMVDLISDLNVVGCRFIVLSYNSDGALSKNDIFDCMKKYGDVTLYKTVSKKFRPNDKVKNSHVVEYIFVLTALGAHERIDYSFKGQTKELWISDKV